MLIRRSGLLLCAAIAACAIPPDRPEDVSATENELRHAPAATRIQAGAHLTVLGVTEDDHVLYWGDGAVWVTGLERGARRRLVVSGGAEPPLTLIQGKVAMIWTAQPFLGNLPGAQVTSPLVVWTAAHGARRAATASLPPQLTSIQAQSAVRPDGREVVFIANVSADGATGDVVRASTDLGRVTTLVSGIDVSQARCSPHLGYDRAAGCGEPRIVVSSCAPGTGPATLARWNGDVRAELTTNMLAGVSWTSDRTGDHLLVQLADGTPTVFALDGTSKVADSRKAVFGWITADGTVFQLPRSADGTARELWRITLGPPSRVERVATLPRTAGLQFANHLPYGVPYANLSTVATVPGGAFAIAFSQFSDATGFTDSLRIDARGRDTQPVAVAADPASFPVFELATRDVRFDLFHRFSPDGERSALFAATAAGEVRQVSSGPAGLGVFGIAGSRIAFADRVTGQLLDGDVAATGDLITVDVGAGTLAPVVVAHGARAVFFLTPARDRLVYTSDADPSAPGLFVHRLRP